jgi:hypothetical protein
MESLHPLRILSNNGDADITTVLHSFFVFAFDPVKSSVDTLARHPINRKNIDTAEDGLKQFLCVPSLFAQDSEEFCVSHVMTNHDGRLFLFARCFNHKIIAVVSPLPILSFFRTLLNQLETLQLEYILPTIYTFCEFPVLPIPSLQYQFEFPNNPSLATISFGSLEFVEDSDFDVIAMTVLTPIMMVKAWEALIVERSVLVVSKDISLLLPCCEFLRKLIAPMSFSGTYVPVMPSSELLEATGTFLMGVELNMLVNTGVPLSGIVLLDLDRRLVIHTPIVYGQNLPEDPYYCAPSCVLQNILRTITAKTQEPLGKWFQRPFHQNYDLESSPSYVSTSRRCTEVLKTFFLINSSLLSSQCCSTKGFFRTVNRPESDNIHYVLGLDSSNKETVSRMGFCEYFGFIVGCMQLWKDTELVDDAIHHTIFCWIELDNSCLAVYEYADDLPLLLIPIEEISSVASCSIEPEGYVFEITLKNQLVFRFTTGDPQSRQLWINAIEHKLMNLPIIKGNPSPAIASLSIIRNTELLEKRILPSATAADSDTFSVKELGYSSSLLRDIDTTTASHYQEFRNLVRKTQNVLFLYAETQSCKYEQLFPHKRENFQGFLLNNHSYEGKMKKYISNIYRTCDMLSQIKKDIDNNRIDDSNYTTHPGTTLLSPVTLDDTSVPTFLTSPSDTYSVATDPGPVIRPIHHKSHSISSDVGNADSDNEKSHKHGLFGRFWKKKPRPVSLIYFFCCLFFNNSFF